MLGCRGLPLTAPQWQASLATRPASAAVQLASPTMTDSSSQAEAVSSTVKRIFDTYTRIHGLIDRAPPDVLFRRWLLDDSLVGWRATCLGARVCRQRTRSCDSRTSLVYESIFIQSGYAGVGNLWCRLVHAFVYMHSLAGVRTIETRSYSM